MAERVSGSLHIHVDHVVKEWWEMRILDKLLASPLGASLVFRGGTALRLAYGSPRFSEDLDFSFLKPVPIGTLDRVARGIAHTLGVTVSDLAEKRWTMLAEFKIKEAWQERRFTLKIECSTRTAYPRPETELRLLTSPTTPLEVLGRVATLARLLDEKHAAVQQRTDSRDVYDAWYIAQKLKVPFVPARRFPRVAFVRDLRKFLPASHWPIVEELARVHAA